MPRCLPSPIRRVGPSCGDWRGRNARVTELAAPFRISLNSVSKHIRILERARLVERRKVGREHILRFRPEPLHLIQKWISQQQDFWRTSLEALDALLDQKDEKEKHR